MHTEIFYKVFASILESESRRQRSSLDSNGYFTGDAPGAITELAGSCYLDPERTLLKPGIHILAHILASQALQ